MSILLKDLYRRPPKGGRAGWQKMIRELMALCIGFLRGLGLKVSSIAVLLGKSLRTIWRYLKGTFGSPGRPRKELTREVKAGVDRMLEARGGRVSIEFIYKTFPQVSRRALGDYKKAWVRRYKAAKRAGQNRLHWNGPGRVWGLDGTFTGVDIEGKGKRLLVARDLAGRYTLAAIPAPEKCRHVIRFLRDIFRKYGAPLVLKHDGGSGFTARKTRRFLRRRGVIALLSPPRYPQYNGATERGMQDVKGFAEVSAALSNHPRKWCKEDLKNAVNMANERLVKRGGCWVSATGRFNLRDPISDEERRRFAKNHQQERKREHTRAERIIARGVTKKQERLLLAKAARLGVSQALVKGGYLNIEEGRISQPITGVNRAMIFKG